MSELLPSGTVTLLLADVEGSTRLWEDQPDEMVTAVARLDRTLPEVIAEHGGVRPVEQGEGDSFVVAFARASDAVGCALGLQRAPLAPIRLRIGLHTGEVQLRDECNYIGPAINRTARLRDLAHGGQTVLSGVTEALVVDRLPADAWLTDLGTHPLRDLPRPERVVQLCHPDLVNEFPPLRVTAAVVGLHLPVQLTSFVGRDAEITAVQHLLADNRLVTLTGAGGAGKTRLAVQVAAQLSAEFGRFRDGVWSVDLSPINDPELVPVTVARALGLPDQPGRSTMDSLTRFFGDRQMLVVLDNCEHLLDASATLIVAVLGACAGLTILATSRESVGVPGEVSWRVPSLSLPDDAVALFADRACHTRPDFTLSDDTAVTVTEICRRLDGMPLAIELAAARVRAMSPAEILDSLHDRFRLLTGGARTAVRRQQTLRASVDWSHTLLTEPERVLLRRLAVFSGGFDLHAAEVVSAGGDVQRNQVFDQLILLVDKSLVVVDDSGDRTRYRLSETVRQYAAEKLGESGEADAVRTRHRDYYTALAAVLDAPAGTDHERRLDEADFDIDNLRAAFGWSRETSATELALQLASSLQPLWLARGRMREGWAWFDAALPDLDTQHPEVADAVRARTLADWALLASLMDAGDSSVEAHQALAIARQVDDPTLLARALTACAYIAHFHDAEAARGYFAEAIGLARKLDDRWRLSQMLAWRTRGALSAGNPMEVRVAGQEGRDLADAIGDRSSSRQCRWCLGMAQLCQGDLAGAAAQFAEVTAEAEAAHDVNYRAAGLVGQGVVLAWQGDAAGARAAADAAVVAGSEVGGVYEGITYGALAYAALADGDVDAALDALDAGQHLTALAAATFRAQATLAGGDLVAARRWADDAVATTMGWWLMVALAARARVAIAQGEPAQAERDAHDALAIAADIEAYLGISDALECLAALAADGGRHREAARLFGAAHGIRERIGEARIKIWDSDFEASVSVLCNALDENTFDTAWAEGRAMSTKEAIAACYPREIE